MSRKTARRLNTLANLLEKAANGLLSAIELVVIDAATPKRIRRARRAR